RRGPRSLRHRPGSLRRRPGSPQLWHSRAARAFVAPPYRRSRQGPAWRFGATSGGDRPPAVRGHGGHPPRRPPERQLRAGRPRLPRPGSLPAAARRGLTRRCGGTRGDSARRRGRRRGPRRCRVLDAARRGCRGARRLGGARAPAPCQHASGPGGSGAAGTDARSGGAPGRSEITPGTRHRDQCADPLRRRRPARRHRTEAGGAGAGVVVPGAARDLRAPHAAVRHRVDGDRRHQWAVGDVPGRRPWALRQRARRGPLAGRVRPARAARRWGRGRARHLVTLTRREISALLRDHGLAPRRSLGQNFVAAPNTVRRIARLAGVGPGDRVVEIGAGLGSLTLALRETGAEVTAIEVDRGLVGVLRSVVEPAGVRVVEGNALALDWGALLGEAAWVLVANLPYNVATPLIVRLLEEVPAIERMLVMVQAEVADRLVARPGSASYGAVSVTVSWWADASVVGDVPQSVFVPRPNVGSSLVALRRRPPPPGDYTRVKAVVR